MPSRNDFSGDSDSVIQAGTVYGGINLYGPGPQSPPPPRQLPPGTTRFVNRDRTLRQLDATSPIQSDNDDSAGRRPGLATIAGPPGVGKTALALHWAHRSRPWFTDGDLYLDMRGYGPGPVLTVDQALDAFLRALHVPAEQIPTDTERRAALYRTILAGRRVLVLLDNVATVGQVRGLLPASPTCMTVVTSRSRLSGLVAREGAVRMTLDVLSPEEALTLLSESVGAGRVAAEPAAAAELTRRCAYLPLAIRIIGERVAAAPHTPLAAYVEELALVDRSLDALAVEDDELSDVRAVFSWSYRSLPDDTRRFFHLLGLPAGSDICTNAAAALAGVSLTRATRLFEQLTAAHLVQDIARDRYRLHDLLRVYALEQAQLHESDTELQAAISRVDDWYLHMAEAGRRLILPHSHAVPLAPADPKVPLTPPTNVSEAMAWFEEERRNLVDTIRQAEEEGRWVFAWQAPVVADGFFELKSYWLDWQEVHVIGLRAARAANSRQGEAANLRCLGDAYWRDGNRQRALDCYHQGIEASREVADHWVEGFCLRGVGLILEEQGQIDEALSWYVQARDVFRSNGITRGEAMSLLSLGNCQRALGHVDHAIDLYGQAVELLDDIDDQWSVAWASYPLGLAYQQAGRYDEARHHHERALELFRRFDDRRCEGLTLAALGDTFHAVDHPEEAQRCWQAALQILDSLHEPLAAHLRTQLIPEI